MIHLIREISNDLISLEQMNLKAMFSPLEYTPLRLFWRSNKQLADSGERMSNFMF